MKQSPLTQLERLPASDVTLAQLERLHAELLEKESKKLSLDPVEFVFVPPKWRSNWIPHDGL